MYLERSGIGSKDVLSKNNVQQLVDLPGVGENYMGSFNLLQCQWQSSLILNSLALDHNLIALPFAASEKAETMDEVFRGTEEQLERLYAVILTIHRTKAKWLSALFVAYVKRWLHNGKGLLASKSVSVVHCFPIVCWYFILKQRWWCWD